MNPIISPIFRRFLRFGLAAFAPTLGGCLSGSDAGAPFHGLWKERDGNDFTVRDSLFRADLDQYADGLGFYVPISLDWLEDPPEGKTPIPDSLFLAFRSECRRSDCDSILKSWRYYMRIEKDSLRRYTFLNGRLEGASTYGFRFDRDSIYENIGGTNFEFASGYRFYANGDSLEIESWGFPSYYGRSREALPPD